MAKHLTEKQRIELETLYRLGYSRRKMAAFLNCSIRTVYYELSRGKCEQIDGKTWRTYYTYSSVIAQKKHDENATAKGRSLKLGNNHAFANYLEQKIGKEKYSPRAALAALDIENKDFNITVSHTTIYRWIYQGYLSIDNSNLPEGRRPKKDKDPKSKKPIIPDKSIELRPKKIESRSTLGHWEFDTVIGKRDGKQPCLLVFTERKTSVELIYKLKSKSPKETVRIIDNIQNKLNNRFSKLFQTLTCDNGCEFWDWKGIEKNNRTTLYYCHPYSSWERPQNERANRLIRRFIPKGKSINDYSDDEIKRIQNWMNHYPRASLGWQRPIDVFTKELKSIGLDCSILQDLF